MNFDTPCPKLKLAIVALLALDAVLFSLFDTWLTAIDATVWLLLLLSYEIEAYPIQQPLSHPQLLFIRRFLIGCVPVPLIGYVLTGVWLEAINALLWFALIALIEIKVSWPDRITPFQRSYWLSNGLIFTGLISLVGIWAWRGEWLQAYDAALWILAFAIIEADISHLFPSPASR